MDTIELTEEGANYLNSLSPEDRDVIYRQLQKRNKEGPPAEGPPVETLASLTERLAAMNPRQHRAEMKEVQAEMDRQLKLNAEHQLSLFINEQFEKGGAMNTKAIKQKAQLLGLENMDVTSHIHLVQKLRRISRIGQGGE